MLRQSAYVANKQLPLCSMKRIGNKMLYILFSHSELDLLPTALRNHMLTREQE